MQEGKVSIIIPVYNAEKYLRACIDSVLKQENIDNEVLLIDDGSTDSSASICMEYTERNSNIFFYPKEHSGVAKTRNYGIDHAEGEFIMFLDSDDYLLDGAVNSLLNGIKNADLSIGDYKYQYEEYIHGASSIQKTGVFAPVDVMHLTCVCGNKLFRANILREFDIYFPDLELGEDLCFYHRYLSVIEKVTLIRNPIYVYRMYEGSSSKTYGTKALDYLEAFRLIESVYGEKSAMKKAFTYDEMFYLKENIKRLPRYRKKNERILIYDRYKKKAIDTTDVSAEAKKIRNWILCSPRYLYCGTIPVFLYQQLRKIKHRIRQG